jgi:tetratricopeptide (TPR) repeat protein
MRPELTRGRLSVIIAGGAVLFGAAGWLWLGPLWAIAGVLAGAPVAFIATTVLATFVTTDPVIHLQGNEPEKAIALLSQEMPGWRKMAQLWPGQFRDTLADRLLVLSEALRAVHREREALGAAEEAVALYQELAATRPGKFTPGLASALHRQALLLGDADRQAEALAALGVAVQLYRNLALADGRTYLPILASCLTSAGDWLSAIGRDRAALAAANEAVTIYLDRFPAADLPRDAARALLSQGRLLCGQALYSRAAKPLAKGWDLAASQHQDDLLRAAVPALKAAYRADQPAFLSAWRAETGHEPPDWLTD